MRRMSISRIIFTTLLSAVLFSVPAFLAAAETEPAEETEHSAETVLIGEKTGDSDYEITLINESGKEIAEIALRASYEEFSDNLLPENAVLTDGGKGILWCRPAQIVNYVPPVYDIRLTFSDDSTAVLHTLPFGDADEITILTDEETQLVYARFFSFSMNSVTDSLQREKNIEKSGEAVLIADYRAKVERTSGSGGGSGSSGSGGGTSAPAPQQCLDNGLMF